MKHRIDKDFIVRKVPFSEKGLVIAFVGQDGSGKTTVANDIIKWLSWKLDVRYYYLGSGENYQSWIKSALQITPNFGPFKIIRRSLFFLKYLKLSKDVKGLVCSAEDYSHKGGIAVFDRFPQTQHLGINDGPKLRSFCGLKVKNKKIISLLKPFFEREEKNIELAARHEPSIVFKLLLSPEESLHRKPENDINIITQKHNIIKSLKFEKSQVYEIDATLPYDKEIILIKNKIWEEIQK